MFNGKKMAFVFTLIVVLLAAALPSPVLAQGPVEGQSCSRAYETQGNLVCSKMCGMVWVRQGHPCPSGTTIQATEVSPPTTRKSAPISTSPTPVTTGGCGTVAVLSGEGGYAVAGRIGCSFGALQAANLGVNLSSLRVGQVLNKPCGGSGGSQPNWAVGVGVAIAGIRLGDYRIDIIEDDPVLNQGYEVFRRVEKVLNKAITERGVEGLEAVRLEVRTAFDKFNSSLQRLPSYVRTSGDREWVWKVLPAVKEAAAVLIATAEGGILAVETCVSGPVIITPEMFGGYTGFTEPTTN